MRSGRFLALTLALVGKRLLQDVERVTQAVDAFQVVALALVAEDEVVDGQSQDGAQPAELLGGRDVPAGLPGRHRLLPYADLLGELRLRQALTFTRLRYTSPDRGVHNPGLYGNARVSTTCARTGSQRQPRVLS